MSRRRFLRRCAAYLGGVAAVPMVVSSRAQGQAKDAGRLVYSGFGGSYEQRYRTAVVEPFEQETGIKVVMTTGAPDVSRTKAMVEVGRVEWDVLETFAGNLGPLLSLDLLDKLDYSVIDTSDLFDQSKVTPYYVPRQLYSINLWWNTNAIPGGLSGWADVWDTNRFPGKRGFSDDHPITLETALIADGVAPNRLYPLDVNRALRSLDKIKSQTVFQQINSLTNLIAQQSVVTGAGGPALNRIRTLIADGRPIKYTWKQAFVDLESLGVLKGAPNRANAMRFVAYTLRPEVQLRVLDALGFTPTVKKARAQIDPVRGADLAASEQTVGDSVFLDPLWYAKHGIEASKQFQKWLLTARS
jgi:putative spermidine/putrescine transport system substrate-binding protein